MRASHWTTAADALYLAEVSITTQRHQLPNVSAAVKINSEPFLNTLTNRDLALPYTSAQDLLADMDRLT